MNSPPQRVLILAAGQGTRMRSDLPKVLHPVAGKPMLVHLLWQVAHSLPQSPIGIVVGYGRDQVCNLVDRERSIPTDRITWIHQDQQLGTGHAVKTALDTRWGEGIEKTNLLILVGDTPLLSHELLESMSDPLPKTTAVRLLTLDVPDPSGLGRIVRKSKAGPVQKIIEHKDANERQLKIKEINTGIHLYNGAFIKKNIQKLDQNNAQGEFYLTDLIKIANRTKKKVQALKWAEREDLQAVNNRWELALVEKIYQKRMIQRWCRMGVTVVDPATTWIEAEVELEADVVIEPGAILKGRTRVKRGTRIGPQVYLENVAVGENVLLRQGTHALDSTIASGATLGPYAHLRPGSVVGEDVKIGNFVELKNSKSENKRALLISRI